MSDGNLAKYTDSAEESFRDQPEKQEFKPLPPGKYHLEIVEADKQESKAGQDMVKVQFCVASGKGEGRRVYKYYMLEGDPEMVRKNQGLLRQLVGFNGKDKLTSTDHLVGVHVIGTLKVEKGNDKYGPSNSLAWFDEYTGPVAEVAAESEVGSWF